jgi:3'-phosphoadenosine 5'-phosphosulfate sulfotransferase (PAPS reductase)/FAD synthetase
VTKLGRKQNIADQHAWQLALQQARQHVPDSELDALISRTVDEIRGEAKRCRVAFAWSGGKDSQALAWLMNQAGIDSCVLGMSIGLEWPAMLAWLTDNMPLACEVIALPLDLTWLRKHPHLLFPQGKDGPQWFSLVQHKAQDRYVTQESVDVLALGRRRADGNYTGPKGEDRYTSARGITRWSPIAAWTHEQVFALISREKLAMPPCYGWPRGFQVGTGPWPARQWTTSADHGFEECWQIDADVIRRAAAVLPQAADWMHRTERE